MTARRATALMACMLLALMTSPAQAQLNEPGATVEGVADRFVAEKRDVWGAWVGTGVP